MADETINERGDLICKKLAAAIEKAVDYEAVKISKGLFRYAVELDVVMQILADIWDYHPSKLHEMRKFAVKNVQNVRGKVRLDDLFSRKDTESL
jgi:hypothetical protein